MGARLDMILVGLAALFAAQLQWRFIPERAFQVVVLLGAAFYLWQLVLAYRRSAQELLEEKPGPSRWIAVAALALFVLYVALRFMWTAAG